MKPNIVGIIGGIIAFISLVLPWWTMAITYVTLGTFTADVSIYPYQAIVSGLGVSTTVDINLWYGYAALVLIVVGGLLGIAGSVMQNGRRLLMGGGILALLSIIVFAVGLQTEISKGTLMPGAPQVGLFSSFSLLGASYTTYLSFGFWIALVSAIIMLIASAKKPTQTGSPPPPPPQPPL